jgi:hypothetical protein
MSDHAWPTSGSTLVGHKRYDVTMSMRPPRVMRWNRFGLTRYTPKSTVV